MRLFILFVLTSLFLTGCDVTSHNKYRYTPPKNSMDLQCVARCTSAQNYCSSICELKNPRCYQRAAAKAKSAFAAYRKEQLAAGHAIQKSEKSFLDNTYCRDACHCITAYNTCYSACGGQVVQIE